MMHKPLRFIALLAFCFTLLPLQAKLIHLLPKPQKVEQTGGAAFSLARNLRIIDADNILALKRFVEENAAGITTDTAAPVISVNRVAAIEEAFDHQIFGFDNEAYRLTISEHAVVIDAVSQIGVIRAVQTLAQLAEGYDSEKALEACTITDWPAFKLRGVMHDVGRSYISVEALKKQIDLLSRFKINVFHWHLT